MIEHYSMAQSYRETETWTEIWTETTTKETHSETETEAPARSPRDLVRLLSCSLSIIFFPPPFL